MPIQPLAPMRRLNSALQDSPCSGRDGSKVPAATSAAMKARTSRRTFSHSSGRRIWSKRSAAVMAFGYSVRRRPRVSARQSTAKTRQGRAPPPAAEPLGPVALVAEILAPGQRPQGVAVQDMLLGEADGAVH